MKDPLVTIIMPVFNTASYLAEAINSVLSQQYTHWELIVVNDGSSDNSDAIINTFTDPRIHYYKQQNKGVSAARNVGLKKMKGSFLCFLDSDDKLSDDSISSRIQMFQDNPNLTFIDGVVEVYEDETSKVIKRWMPGFTGSPQKKLLQLSDECFLSLSWMIRIIPSIHYQFPEDMKHAEDLFFLLSISDNGMYSYVSNTIYKYRIRKDSAMRDFDKLGQGYAQLYKKIQTDFGHRQNLLQRFYLFYRIRRIMVLTYLSKNEWRKAISYLIKGAIE